MEIARLGADPREKAGQGGLPSQGLYIAQPSREFGFGEQRVDRAVADLVEANRSELRPALETGYKMVPTGLGAGWDRTLA